MRIWYQSMAPLYSLGAYVEALEAHAAKVASEGTEVVFNGASERFYGKLQPQDVVKYPYAKHVVQREALEFCWQAEQQGFDAVILGSFSEPFLVEARALVDIPVISMPESTLLASCSLAPAFALVTLSAKSAVRNRALVARHKLEGRVSGYYPMPSAWGEAELDEALREPAKLVADFEVSAAAAVAAGADLLIPAEGVFNEVLFKNGIARFQDTPVMDCVGAALLAAEMLVNLRRRAGISVGRQWAYAKPGAEMLADIRKHVAGD